MKTYPKAQKKMSAPMAAMKKDKKAPATQRPMALGSAAAEFTKNIQSMQSKRIHS